MSKNLINSAGDFLHLYLGCPVLVTPYEGASYECKLSGVSIEKVGGETEIKVQVFEDDGPDGYEGHRHKWFDAQEVELMLRKIETMTEDEQREIGMDAMEVKHAVSQKRNPAFYTKEFLFLLKNGFDVFGLIEAGFAIDSTDRIQELT